MRQIKLKALITLSLFFFISDSSADDAPKRDYLCVSEKASGFKFVRNDWISTTFSNDVEKYHITYSKNKNDYELKNIGTNKNDAWDCKQQSYTAIFCKKSHDEEFRMSLMTMRYHAVYRSFINGSLGWLSQQHQEGYSDTPYIEMGSCIQIDR